MIKIYKEGIGFGDPRLLSEDCLSPAGKKLMEQYIHKHKRKKTVYEPARIHRLNEDALLRRRHRELELSRLGLTHVEIAERMGISEWTVADDINILKWGTRHPRLRAKKGDKK